MPENMRVQLAELRQRVEEDADRQTASLAALALILFLITLGLFLVRELHAKSALEDCLLSGCTKYSALVAPSVIEELRLSAASSGVLWEEIRFS
jgi:hypothetical protein